MNLKVISFPLLVILGCVLSRPMVGQTLPATPLPSKGESSQSAGWSSMYTRAVVGLDFSGASSQMSQEKAFLEFNLTAPLSFLRDHRKFVQDEDCRRAIEDMRLTKNTERSSNEGQATSSSTDYEWDSGKTTGFFDACGKVDSDIQKPTGTLYNQDMTRLVDLADKRMTLDESPVSHRFWMFFNPRISSIPDQAKNALGAIPTTSSNLTSLLNTELNQTVESFEMLTGVELALLKPTPWTPLSTSGLGISLVGAGGLSTPLNSSPTSPQIYKLTSNLTSPQLQAIFGPNSKVTVCSASVTANCLSDVAFVPPDLSHFYKEYYGGIRIKSFFFKSTKYTNDESSLCADKLPGQLCPIFPGTFDVMVGQNAAVTGAGLHGVVLRTEAFYPLPFLPYIHLFSTTWTRIGGKNSPTSAFPPLNLADSDVTLSSPNLQIVSLQPSNRDLYRIGIGIDLINFIQVMKNNPSSGKSDATNGGKL